MGNPQNNHLHLSQSTGIYIYLFRVGKNKYMMISAYHENSFRIKTKWYLMNSPSPPRFWCLIRPKSTTQRWRSYPPLFLGQPPFLEIQDVATFYRPNRKTKVLNESSNRLLYKFYPQSILILEEYLLKW